MPDYNFVLMDKNKCPTPVVLPLTLDRTSVILAGALVAAALTAVWGVGSAEAYPDGREGYGMGHGMGNYTDGEMYGHGWDKMDGHGMDCMGHGMFKPHMMGTYGSGHSMGHSMKNYTDGEMYGHGWDKMDGHGMDCMGHGMGHSMKNYTDGEMYGHGWDKDWTKEHGMKYMSPGMFSPSMMGPYGSGGLAELMLFDLFGPPADQTISARGHSTATVEPENLMITLGVDTVAETASEALSENSRIMNDVTAALLALNVGEDEISTTRISIHPEYGDVPNPITGGSSWEMIGYGTSNIITITTAQMDRAGEILDGAVGAGANRVEDVRFSASLETIADVRMDLIGQAVLNALEKAELALDPLEYRISGVKSINVDGASTPGSSFVEDQRYALALSAVPPIFSPDQTVSVAVSVTFFIEPVLGFMATDDLFYGHDKYGYVCESGEGWEECVWGHGEYEYDEYDKDDRYEHDEYDEYDKDDRYEHDEYDEYDKDDRYEHDEYDEYDKDDR